jgi:hypothetical protein
MQQVELSYRSTQASVTSLQYQSSRQDLAVRLGQPSQNLDLSRQQRQIIDEVGISQEAVAKLREAQELANQLQNYLDYLNGKTKALGVQIVPVEERGDIEIAGQSTNLAASITMANYKEISIDVSASFDDAGNLQSLSVSQSQVEAQYIQANISLEQKQFYAQL